MVEPVGEAAFDALSSLVRSRRTSLLLDRERPVDDALIDRLCELATWAPAHKRTWPWRFAWVTGDGRSRLGEAAAEAMQARGDEAAKVAKTRTKYLRAVGMLVVGSDAGDSELRRVENAYAAAAGLQNLLLGATAAGLSGYWSSCPKGADAAVAGVCQFPGDTTIVGLVYLGWPTGSPPAPARPPARVTRVT